MPDSKSTPAHPLYDWPRESGQVAAVLANMEAKLAARRRGRIRMGGSAAAILIVALWAVPYFRSTSEISTPAAQRSSVALADGSTAELNARTSLKTDFRYGRRTIQLTAGEAFFSVAKDLNHPFVVVTSTGTVRVLGTQFNVRLDEKGAAEITLLEGSVAFDDDTASTTLKPGDQLRSNRVRPLTSAELDRVTSWRTGQLMLDHLTLVEAAARFGAYHGKQIDVAPDVAALRLGGTCPLDDLPGFFEFIRESAKVRVLMRREGVYLITQP